MAHQTTYFCLVLPAHGCKFQEIEKKLYQKRQICQGGPFLSSHPVHFPIHASPFSLVQSGGSLLNYVVFSTILMNQNIQMR